MDEPQFPEAFASMVVGLGAPRRYFPVKTSRRIGSLVIALILAAGSGLVFFYGLYVSYLDYQNHGLVMTERQVNRACDYCFCAVTAGDCRWLVGVRQLEQGCGTL